MSLPEPPIQNMDRLDIVGVRKDGGVDLVVTCSGPLDESTETLLRLRQKVRNYLCEIPSEEFRGKYGTGKVSILLSCEHSVSAGARDLIKTLEEEAASQNVELHLVNKVA